MLPNNITSTLQSIFDQYGDQIIISAVSSFAPWVAVVFNIPIIGSLLKSVLNYFVNGLIAAAVIDVKIGIIQFMSSQAQANWAKELVVLKQVHATGGTLTAEQLGAFDAALQAIGKSHSGVVQS